MAADFPELVPAAPITLDSDVAVHDLPSVRLVISALFHSNSMTVAELMFQVRRLARNEVPKTPTLPPGFRVSCEISAAAS